MTPRTRAALLWGLVGGLAFLVLAQGYRIATGRGPALALLVAVALVVAVGAGALTYALDPWLAKRRV